MASTTNTISHGWREKGNTSYRNFRDSNSAERQKNYLESALKSYYRGYETADSNVDKSSAAKNYGIASWRLANVLIELDEKDSLCEFRRREAISYFSKVRLVCWNVTYMTMHSVMFCHFVAPLQDFSAHILPCYVMNFMEFNPLLCHQSLLIFMVMLRLIMLWMDININASGWSINSDFLLIFRIICYKQPHSDFLQQHLCYHRQCIRVVVAVLVYLIFMAWFWCWNVGYCDRTDMSKCSLDF